jgi:hypothetical protein
VVVVEEVNGPTEVGVGFVNSIRFGGVAGGDLGRIRLLRIASGGTSQQNKNYNPDGSVAGLDVQPIGAESLRFMIQGSREF